MSNAKAKAKRAPAAKMKIARGAALTLAHALGAEPAPAKTPGPAKPTPVARAASEPVLDPGAAAAALAAIATAQAGCAAERTLLARVQDFLILIGLALAAMYLLEGIVLGFEIVRLHHLIF